MPRVACLAGSLALIALTGCGGSDFKSKADGVCKKYNAKIKAVRTPTTGTDVPSYLNQIVLLASKGIAELRKVKPPSDKKAGYEDYLATLGQEETAFVQAQTAANGGDTRGALRIISRLDPVNSEGNRKARALGLNECGKD